MKLSGKVFDFGDRPISGHLHKIATEIEEQAFLNGEDDPDISRGHQPLYDLSRLLERLAAAVHDLEERDAY